jgi:hypothetical protein
LAEKLGGGWCAKPRDRQATNQSQSRPRITSETKKLRYAIINAPRRRETVTDHLTCLGFIPFTYNRLIERLTLGFLCCGSVLRNISAARIGLGRQGAASESSSCDVA